MKKITFKIAAVLCFIVASCQLNAQAWDGTAGTYRIVVDGEGLCLTLPDTAEIGAGESQTLTYETVDENSNAQIFLIGPHPSGTHFSITSVLPGKGVVEILDPQNANSALGCKNNPTAGEGSQLDQWNPTRGSGTQIFLESPTDGTAFSGIAKRRIQNFAQGDPVKVSGGGPVTFSFVPATPVLNTKTFDVNSVFVSNPVINNMAVSGLSASIKKMSVYSILGEVVLAKQLSGQSSLTLDLSALTSGLYVVEFKGEGSVFTKKIIKQ